MSGRWTSTDNASAFDAARDLMRVLTFFESVVHLTPLPGSGLSRCCGRTTFELPAWDRITNDQRLVTCAALPTSPEREGEQ